MKKRTHLFASVTAAFICLAIVFSVAGCGTQKADTALDPENPVTVTVWNYYNGDQLAAFEQLVADFNSTVGMEKGIVVVNVSHGDINTLADSLIASVNGEPGAQELPSLAAVYSETAYILDQSDALEAFDAYVSDEVIEQYIPGFINEGRFNAENELLLFPMLKSTELFTANQTDWVPFAAATGITLESITTKEELTEAAKAYYEWTDSLTPDVPEDGKALYGRDSVANYLYIGSYQLGHELFSIKDGALKVDMDRDTFKILWDNFYVPYVNGYFGAYAKFRSEDCKTGKILALTSSSSSVSYLPVSVTAQDDSSHDIEIFVRNALPFGGGANDAVVQQGASYCMLKSTPAQQEGATEFLKWFTQPERNLNFALMSGYSPVTLAANTQEAISAAYDGDTSSAQDKNILSALLINAETFSNSVAYATKPFSGSKEVRTILGDSLETIAQADREKVLEAINGGASREEAVAEFVTDEYFDAWFDALCEDVSAAIGQ